LAKGNPALIKERGGKEQAEFGSAKVYEIGYGDL